MEMAVVVCVFVVFVRQVACKLAVAGLSYGRVELWESDISDKEARSL